jgi:DNA-binding transcriptional MerR regulator
MLRVNTLNVFTVKSCDASHETGVTGGRVAEGERSLEAAGWRIDDLARESGLTVDTIRFYRREGLLPPATRVGRTKRFGRVHLERLERIRELQQRRFSLAAIRALLEAERPGLVEGIFSGSDAGYSYAELVSRSGVDPVLADRLRDTGLVRDPGEFGRDAYDGADLELLRAVAELQRLGLPGDVVVELGRIYTEGVERMQSQVLDLFTGRRGPGWKDAEELRAFQSRAAASAGDLLPTVTRLVEYVHRRTLQRLTLGAIEREADPAAGS